MLLETIIKLIFPLSINRLNTAYIINQVDFLSSKNIFLIPLLTVVRQAIIKSIFGKPSFLCFAINLSVLDLYWTFHLLRCYINVCTCFCIKFILS